MTPVKEFFEYVDKGTVKKQTVDSRRADFLYNEAENTYSSLIEYIDHFSINDKNSNMIVKMSYDVIMEFIRGRMLLDGFNASGYGAHEAEVSYLRELDFSDADVEFVNRLRYFRNGIIYYGKVLDKEYADKVLNFLNKIRKLLI